jgi:hypothetical protein
MALPDPEQELAVLNERARKRALIKLLLVVLTTDAVAIAGCLVLVYGYGWDMMTAFIPLLVVAMVTGAYYQAKNREILQK